MSTKYEQVLPCLQVKTKRVVDSSMMVIRSSANLHEELVVVVSFGVVEEEDGLQDEVVVGVRQVRYQHVSVLFFLCYQV